MQLRIPTKQLLEKEKANLSVLLPYGSDIWQPTQEGCERVAFQNARGITRWPDPANEVISAAAEYGIGIFGVAEPNCAWDENMTAAVNAAAKKAFGCGFISPASMPSKKKGYLPGGIMQLIRGNVAGRHEKSGKDRYGQY